jgi:hypothetical protein
MQKKAKLMKYMIVRSESEGVLMAKVNSLLEYGWKPQGGLAISCRDNGMIVYYAQAMIKKEKKNGEAKGKAQAKGRKEGDV